MITENLSTLKIHKLTQAQYNREFEAGNIDENALYLTPDEVEIEVDSVLSSTSENPVQNKVIASEFSKYETKTDAQTKLDETKAYIDDQVNTLSAWHEDFVECSAEDITNLFK